MILYFFQDLETIKNNNEAENGFHFNQIPSLFGTSTPIVPNTFSNSSNSSKIDINKLNSKPKFSCKGFDDCLNKSKQNKKNNPNNGRNFQKNEIQNYNILQSMRRLEDVREKIRNMKRTDIRYQYIFNKTNYQDIQKHYGALGAANGRQVLDINSHSNVFDVKKKNSDDPWKKGLAGVCDKACKAARLANTKKRGGYSSRVLVITFLLFFFLLISTSTS